MRTVEKRRFKKMEEKILRAWLPPKIEKRRKKPCKERG